MESIMNSNIDEAADLTWKMLYDSDSEVRKNAVVAFYNLEGRDGLIKLLSDETINVDCKEEAQNILLEAEDDEDE